MQDRLVRFNLFGQEFAFYSDAPAEEVESVIALLRHELESNEKLSRSAVPSSKMLVLGCLRIAAKYVHLEREYGEFRQAQHQVVGNLIDKVTANLE
jgi:cell division protein ZapA